MYKNLSLLLLFTLLLAGCSGETGGTSVWIDIPLNPTNLKEAVPVDIVGHASSPEGVSKVEIWVNGSLVDTIMNPSGSGNLAKFESSFTPTGPGEYVVQVVATGTNGDVSDPDSALVNIIAESVEEILPTPTSTPTLVPEEDDQPVINYWAEPETIEAGACTTIYWDVQNVSKVEFGGREQSFQGSYEDCMCESQTYPMTITYLDGSQETFRRTIYVTGQCATATTPPPPPAEDNQGPSDPTILKPVNGQEFSCLSYLMLRWTAVSDPSGIDEYQIQIERHPGDNNWQPWQGGTITGIPGLEKELYVECGFIYRYRVRGVDGEGNIGDWSDWSYFTVNIG